MFVLVAMIMIMMGISLESGLMKKNNKDIPTVGLKESCLMWMVHSGIVGTRRMDTRKGQ